MSAPEGTQIARPRNEKICRLPFFGRVELLVNITQCLSVCPSVRLSVCPSVCLSVAGRPGVCFGRGFLANASRLVLVPSIHPTNEGAKSESANLLTSFIFMTRGEAEQSQSNTPKEGKKERRVGKTQNDSFVLHLLI